jgi:hypothetical protein
MVEVSFAKKYLPFAAYITLITFIAHYFSGFLENMVMAGNKNAWFFLFIWYTLWFAIGLYLFDKVKK